MAINKIIDRNGNSILDLSTDDLDSDTSKVLQGCKYHGKDGKTYIGTRLPKRQDNTETIKFIDWDGEVLYEYTLAEAKALTELPSYPNATKAATYGLIFKEWNWSLDEIKLVEEDEYCLPVIGALMNTDIDVGLIREFEANKVYKFGYSFSSRYAISYYRSGQNYTSNQYVYWPTTLTIDWGDGTTSTLSATGLTDSTSKVSGEIDKVYENPGEYFIKIRYSSEKDERFVIGGPYYNGDIEEVGSRIISMRNEDTIILDRVISEVNTPLKKNKFLIFNRSKQIGEIDIYFSIGGNIDYNNKEGASTFFGQGYNRYYSAITEKAFIDLSKLTNNSSGLSEPFTIENFALILDKKFNKNYLDGNSISYDYHLWIGCNAVSTFYSFDNTNKKIGPNSDFINLWNSAQSRKVQMWFPKGVNSEKKINHICILHDKPFLNKENLNLSYVRIADWSISDFLYSVVKVNINSSYNRDMNGRCPTNIKKATVCFSAFSSDSSYDYSLKSIKFLPGDSSFSESLLGSNSYIHSFSLLETIDLTALTEVPVWSGSPTNSCLFGNSSVDEIKGIKHISILVPSNLLEEYKTANGWKELSHMFVSVDV